MQPHTQADIVTTNLKVNIDFNLPELSVMEIVTWYCHVDDSAKGSYHFITLSKHMMVLLKVIRHPWLIWVHINFNI